MYWLSSSDPKDYIGLQLTLALFPYKVLGNSIG